MKCQRITVRQAYWHVVEPNADTKIELEAHYSECQDCSTRVMIVTELLLGQQKTSQQEELFAVKLSVNPVFEDVLDRALEGIKQEIKEELAKEDVKKRDTPKLEQVSKGKDQANVISLGPAAIILAILLVSFTTPTYLTSQNIQPLTLTVKTENSYGYYNQIKQALNNYLTSQKEADLTKATDFALLVKQQYNDSIGVDSINFYKSVDPRTRQKILALRQQVDNLANYTAGSEYISTLKQLEQAEQEFLALKDRVDALQVKSLIAKTVFLNSMSGAIETIDSGIAQTHNYPSLQIQFTLWKAKYLLETDRKQQGVTELRDVAQIAKTIGMTEVHISAVKSLAAVLHFEGKDEEALALAQSVLSLSDDYRGKISLLHVCAGASARLKHATLATAYMEQAIRLAVQHQDKFLLSFSYVWQGMIKTENGQYFEAETYYQKAEIHATGVSAVEAKNDLTFRIAGYRAKNYLAEGNYSKAVIHYEAAIAGIEKFQDTSRYATELSELHSGISIAINKSGSSKINSSHEQLAKKYQKLTNKNAPRLCVFSFSPCA